MNNVHNPLASLLNSVRLPFRLGQKNSKAGQPTIWLDFEPVPSQQAGQSEQPSQWLHKDSGLLAVMTQTQYQQPSNSFVQINQVTLTNTSDKPSPALAVIEPLAIQFECDSFAWNHTRLRGGTSEHMCPPQAFHPETFWDMDRYLILESHPAGRSSNLFLPLMISVLPTVNAGIYYGLEWSAHWYIHTARSSDQTLDIVAGVKIDNLSLDPGETLELPASHLGFFEGDLQQGTNALRQHLRQNVLPDYDNKPCLPRVTYDHWFGVENEVDTDFLIKQVDVAANLGVEVFAHDTAWFEGGFPEGVGNWQRVDLLKHPNGLEPLAEYVRSKGMDFGLWFEIERATPGSDAVREHPEMFTKGYPPIHGGAGGEQYHLNLARKDAQDWVIDTLDHWIRKLDLRWSRWDYNIEPGTFWNEIDPTGKIQFHYMQGLYRVLDTLMQRHPKWMIEMCASGGRRIDLGILKRSHTLWFSDQTKLPSLCRLMQAHANLMLPGRLLNSSVAIPKGSGAGASVVELDDTMILSRMLGKLAFDGDIARISASSQQRAKHWISVFKKFRHLMDENYIMLRPTVAHPDMLLAAAFISPLTHEAIVFAFAGQHGETSSLHLPFVTPGGQYELVDQASGDRMLVSAQQLQVEGMNLSMGAGQSTMWSLNLAEG